MPKTLEKFFNGMTEPRAIVLLDSDDLRHIDAIERASYGESSWKFKQDPAAALAKLLDYQVRAATRVVVEAGPVEIIVAALLKFKEWVENSRKVRKALPGIWMEEPEPAAPAAEEKG